MCETVLTSTGDLGIYRASATGMIIRVYSDIRAYLSSEPSPPGLISSRPEICIEIPYNTRSQVDGPQEGWTTIQPRSRPHPTKNVIVSHAMYTREYDGARLPLSAAHWLDFNQVVQSLQNPGQNAGIPRFQRDVHKHMDSISSFGDDPPLWVASSCGYHVCWMQTDVTDRVHILRWHSPDHESDSHVDLTTLLLIPNDLQDTIQGLAFCDETSVLVLRCWDTVVHSLVLHLFQF